MDTISGSAETLRKIRNTLRFILGNLSGNVIEQKSKPDNLSFVRIRSKSLDCLSYS